MTAAVLAITLFGLDLDARLPPYADVLVQSRQSVTLLCLTYEAKRARPGDATAEANHAAASRQYRFWMLCRWRHEGLGDLAFWWEQSAFLRERLP